LFVIYALSEVNIPCYSICVPRTGQTKDYKIGICCFSTTHAEWRRKSKDWL